MSREIVLISSCTASKRRPITFEATSVETLYTGQQHVRLMRGVEAYRRAGQPAGELRFRILSALHGLLEPTVAIEPYDHSFSGLTVPEIHRQAEERHIPSEVSKLLRRPYALGLVLLADPYLRACDLTTGTELGGPVIAFCSPAAGSRLPRISGLRVVTLTNADARRFSCGMIALKGELGRRLLLKLADAPESLDTLCDPDTDVLASLDASRDDSHRVKLSAA